MPRSFHHSLNVQYSLFPKPVRALFVGHLLRGIAQQTVGLFVPLYLFTQTAVWKLWPFSAATSQLNGLQLGILSVVSFFFLSRLAVLFLYRPSVWLMQRLHLTKSMVVGNVFLILCYLLLAQLSEHPWAMIPAAIFDGLSILFYWVCYHTQFAIHADLSKLGSEVGSIEFLDKLVRASMPMVGGVLIVTFGFGSSYIAASILMMFASTALFFLKEVSISYTAGIGQYLRWFLEKKHWRMVLSFMGKYLDSAAITLWPVFVFLMLGTVERVGYLYSVALFISLIIAYFMGWYLLRHRGRLLLYLSASVVSLAWMVRSIVSSLWHVLLADVMDRLANSVYLPIYETFYFRNGRGKEVFQHHLFREITDSLAAVVFWPLVFIGFLLPMQWTGVFLLGAVGVFLSLGVEVPIGGSSRGSSAARRRV